MDFEFEWKAQAETIFLLRMLASKKVYKARKPK